MVWLHECESLMRARTLAQKPPHLVLNRYTFNDAVALKPGQAPTRATHREIEAAFFTRGHAWRACLHALERTKKSKEYARRGGGTPICFWLHQDRYRLFEHVVLVPVPRCESVLFGCFFVLAAHDPRPPAHATSTLTTPTASTYRLHPLTLAIVLPTIEKVCVAVG